MQQITIQRDAPVMATDGELGRVKHVVVDPDSREVTEIVVADGKHEWLIPMRAVVSLDGETIVLSGARHQFSVAPAFRRDEFEPVDGAQAESEAAGRARHGGAPLVSADEDAVVAGDEAAPGGDATLRHLPTIDELPTAIPPVPPPPPMDVSEAAPMVAAAFADEDDGIDADAVQEVVVDEPRAEIDAEHETATPAPPRVLRLEEGAEQVLELNEERLVVNKEASQAGLVRVRKVVTERVETVEVPLREERLVFEVLPGSGTVTIDGRVLEAGDALEVPLLEERATVVKETVVSEDVIVRKETVVVEETFEETLRREELVVDGDGDLFVQDEDDDSSAADDAEARAPAYEPHHSGYRPR